MDALELLEQAGEVPPADEATIEAAVELVLTAAHEQRRGPAPPRPPTVRSHRRRRRTALGGVAVTAAVAALVVATVVLVDGSHPGSPVFPASGPHPRPAGPVALTAEKVRVISSQSAAATDSGTAVETEKDTVDGSATGSPGVLDVTFSGQNVNYLTITDGNGAEGVQDRMVDGQLYVYVKGPDLQMHWYHEIEAGAAPSLPFPDPRTLLQGVSPSAGLVSLGQQSVDGTELTHLRATTPSSIGQLGIPGVVGTVTSFDVWVDSDGVARRMTLTSSDGTACATIPDTVPPGTTTESPSTTTVSSGAGDGTRVGVGNTCVGAQTVGSTLGVQFANLGAPESVTAPSGAIGEEGSG
jgi:hypothetical protein